MATQLQIKRTTITGRTPNTTNSGNSTYISAGELAINLTDGKLFSSNGTSLIYIGSNVSTLNVTSSVNLPNTVTVSGTSGTNGQYLGIVGANLAFASLPPTISIYDASNTLLSNAYFITGSSLNQLSDVDTATTAPANNNLLMWSNGVSNWVPSGNVDVTSIKINGNQAVNGPAFSAYPNSSVTQTILSNGAQQKVLFQLEEFDTNNNFANSRFTPTVAGYYQLNATVRIAGTMGTGESMLVIWKNGSEYKRGWNASGTENGANFFALSVNTLAYANGAGDYFEVYIQQGSGGSRDVTVAGGNITWFNGAMVRGA